MKRIIGPERRKRLSGMFASFAQLILGAGFVSYFFREGNTWLRWGALIFFAAFTLCAVWAEPESEVI